MAALLPTPSSDRDPGSRQRPGQQQLLTRHSRICFLILPWTTGKGQLKERAVLGCLSCFPPFLLDASSPVVLSLFPCFLFPFAFLPLPSFPCPCFILPLFLFLLLSSRPLPSLLLSPTLLISLPQHPVPSLWCVLVLAKARPGRTDGYLVRQRSPWAPTPFPPPGAAQVSRWKVRGARRGKEVLGLKPRLGVLLRGTRGQAARRETAFKVVQSGAPGEMGNGAAFL